VEGEEEEEEEEEARTAALGGAERLNKAQIIQRQLQSMEESNKQMIAVMNELQGNCIYCQLIRGRDVEDQGAHAYTDCTFAEGAGCGYKSYQR
jgi:hypothetical protein